MSLRTILLLGAAYLVLTARPQEVGRPAAPAVGGYPYDLILEPEVTTPVLPVPSWQVAGRPPASMCRPCPPGLVCTMQCITDAPAAGLGVVAA